MRQRHPQGQAIRRRDCRGISAPAQPPRQRGRQTRTDEVIGVSRLVDEGGCSCQDVRTSSVSNGHKHQGGAAMRYFARLERASDGGNGAMINEKPGSHGTANREKKRAVMVSTIKGSPSHQSIWRKDDYRQASVGAKRARPSLTGRRRYLGWFADGKHQHMEFQLAPPCATSSPVVRRSHERKALRRHLLPERIAPRSPSRRLAPGETLARGRRR
jgi:hypothetical protein